MTARSIADAFGARRARGTAALVPYVTSGHPTRGDTVPMLDALAGAGADVIELGVPFSDPLADGPTIQRSSYDALQGGATVATTLEALARFREGSDVPVVLFTYLNPVLRYGVEAFLQAAHAAGAQGLLLTDLPTGADPDLEGAVTSSPLDLIRLVAPTTPPERIASVAEGGSGFLYYISRTGVTGAGVELRGELEDEVRAVQGAVELPVAVGFGISTPEQAGRVGRVADGVVVGSAVVRTLGDAGVDAAGRFVASLRKGIDEG